MAASEWIKVLDLGRLSSRARAMVVLAAITLAGFLFFYLFLPVHRQTATLVHERGLLKGEIRLLEDEIRESESIARRVQATDSARRQFSERDSTLPSRHEGFSLILDELYRLAGTASVEFVSVRPEAPERRGAMWSQPFTTDVASTFEGLGTYLRMLEGLPRLMVIENLAIEADPDRPAHVLGKLHLRVYLEPDEVIR